MIKYSLLLLVLCISSSVFANSLGTYTGNPDGTDPGAMLQFEAAFDNFTKAMGVKPTFMNTFIDYSKDWDTWVDNAKWTAWSWTLSNRSIDLIPVIGIPMIPSSYYGTEDTGFNEVISGQHDAVFQGIIQAFIANNFTTLHLRIGWEANGNWYAWNWNTKNSTGDSILPQWIAAWAHIAKVVKGVPGVTVYTNWNPCVLQWTEFDSSLAYPGDALVDVIALDIYSPVWPGSLWDWEFNNGTMAPNISVWSQSAINREHYWSYPGASQWNQNSTAGWGMISHLAFAKTRNKPVAFCESGVGLSPGALSNGINDDGDFPIYLRKMLDDSGVQFLYIDIWDVNVGDGLWKFSDGTKPKTAAAWRAAFAS